MKTFRPRFLFAVLMTLMGCNRSTDGCSSDQACTMEFRYLTVQVKDSTNTPYYLDSVYTRVNASGDELHLEEMFLDSGTYVVLTDAQKELTSLEGDTFTFVGYKLGQLKVNEQYIVRHDCCHIELVSGNEAVTVQ